MSGRKRNLWASRDAGSIIVVIHDGKPLEKFGGLFFHDRACKSGRCCGELRIGAFELLFPDLHLPAGYCIEMPVRKRRGLLKTPFAATTLRIAESEMS